MYNLIFPTAVYLHFVDSTVMLLSIADNVVLIAQSTSLSMYIYAHRYKFLVRLR